MISPAPRIAGSVDVLATEEIGLHVHLLNGQFAFLDALVNPLAAGIEAAHVAAHGNDPRLFGDPYQVLSVLNAVGDRDLDQHVLAGAHHLLALPEMHLGRRGQDHRVGALDALGEIAGVMWDSIFLGNFRGCILIAANERRDLHLGNPLERVEMLLAESALAHYAILHVSTLQYGERASAEPPAWPCAGYCPRLDACSRRRLVCAC